MQSLFVIYASFIANGGCQVCHTGAGRGAMRAASACDSKGQAKACVQQGHDRELPEWVPASYLCVIVSAVCVKRTINLWFNEFDYR